MVEEVYEVVGERCEVYNGYGPTEATVNATIYRIGGKEEVRGERRERIAIGRVSGRTKAYILDDRMEVVARGVKGEMYIGGEGVGRGYLGRAEMTGERFVPDPYSEEEGGRMYRTGDEARYLMDGRIEYIGRVDEQVKVRGYRIELGEIEAVLAGAEGVSEAVVSCRESERGDKQLVAYLVVEDEKIVRDRQLRAYLKERLPEYMVPTAFVRIERIPMTPNGKVDRKMLPTPEGTSIQTGGVYVAPRSPQEEMLAAIWSEVLDVEKVSIHDNFFELGGHSLKVTQVLSRVREIFDVEVPMRKLFENQTIGESAGMIEGLQKEEDGLKAPPMKRMRTEGAVPLSYSQNRLWILQQLDPGTFAYNMPSVLRLIGNLDLLAIEESFKEILQRHEALRTKFVNVDGEPAQIISPAGQFNLGIIDLTEMDESVRLRLARQVVEEGWKGPFNLEEGRLFRATLIRLGLEDHLLLITIHHIAADGWSEGVLFKELSALYQSYTRGEESCLEELEIQYADYALWQRQWLKGKALENLLGYWKRHLGAAARVLELPFDRPRPSVRTTRGAAHDFELTQSSVESLKRMGRSERASFYMVLLAAFKMLLYRYTGQQDISVGSYIANRNRKEIEQLIGVFVNSLVMRTEVSDGVSFRQLVHRVRETALGAYAHQDLPFEILLEALHPDRDKSHTPFYQVMLVLQNARSLELEMSNLDVSSFDIWDDDRAATIAKFDLTMWMKESGGILLAGLEYNADLFDHSTIERMVSHFKTLLEGAELHPDTPLSALPLMSEAERDQLVVVWNQTAIARSGGECIHELIEQQVERTSEAVAVSQEEEAISYGELNRRANQLAHYLMRHGAGPETIVGICMDRSVEQIVGLLGILKAGAAYVPVDPTYPPERQAYMLEDSRAKLLVTHRGGAGSLAGVALKVVRLDDDWEDIGREGQENPFTTLTEGNRAYVIYTSGSTQKPRGVMVEHRSIVGFTHSAIQQYDLNSEDRVLQFASISFDASAEEIYPCLATGARLVLRTQEMAATVKSFKEKCHEWKVTVADLPTAYWHELTSLMNEEEWREAEDLRLVIIGGEKALGERVREWRERVGKRVRLINSYGPTETTVVATIGDLSILEEDKQEVTIGRPIAGVKAYVLDHTLEVVPIGVKGELYIAGQSVARGYLGEPAQTAEKFIPDPFARTEGGRLYRTGDVVRLCAGGNIEFVGRKDGQVKIRGYRIELAEIEAVLAEYPAIKEAVVEAGEQKSGEKRLVAYVAKKEGHQVDDQELRRFARKRLPEFMVPASFVVLDALPLTGNGKIDRRALPALERPELTRSKAVLKADFLLELQLNTISEELLKRA